MRGRGGEGERETRQEEKPGKKEGRRRDEKGQGKEKERKGGGHYNTSYCIIL